MPYGDRDLIHTMSNSEGGDWNPGGLGLRSRMHTSRPFLLVVHPGVRATMPPGDISIDEAGRIVAGLGAFASASSRQPDAGEIPGAPVLIEVTGTPLHASASSHLLPCGPDSHPGRSLLGASMAQCARIAGDLAQRLGLAHLRLVTTMVVSGETAGRDHDVISVAARCMVGLESGPTSPGPWNLIDLDDLASLADHAVAAMPEQADEPVTVYAGSPRPIDWPALHDAVRANGYDLLPGDLTVTGEYLFPAWIDLSDASALGWSPRARPADLMCAALASMPLGVPERGFRSFDDALVLTGPLPLHT